MIRGIVRRCQALQALGYSLEFQAEYSGLALDELETVSNGRECSPSAGLRIVAMFDALAWSRPRPDASDPLVADTLAKARRCAYVAPAGWDDIDSDDQPARIKRDPDFIDPLKLEIRLSGGKVRFNQAESHAATYELADRGYNQLEISNILFITQSAVAKRLQRQRNQKAVTELVLE